MRGRH